MSRKHGNRSKRPRGPMGRPRYKPVDDQLWAAYPELRSKLAPRLPRTRQGTSVGPLRREGPRRRQPAGGTRRRCLLLIPLRALGAGRVRWIALRRSCGLLWPRCERLQHDGDSSGVAAVRSLRRDAEMVPDLFPCPARTSGLDHGRFSSCLEQQVEVSCRVEGSGRVTSSALGIGQREEQNLCAVLRVECWGGFVGHVVKCT